MKEFILEKNDARMRYHDLSGEEIPILFIHGLGCASSFDYPQVASMTCLLPHRRILIDLLGSGFSDKPDEFNYAIADHADYLDEFIKNLGIREMIVYGHSMGGAIAISLVARCKKQVKGLILSEANLDSGGGFFSKKIASYGEQEYLNIGHPKIIQESIEDANENWAASLLVTSPRAAYREARSLVEGQSPSWREILYSLKTSRTFIFGEQSLPDSDMDELQKESIHVEKVKEAGHSMAWENPEGLADAIKNGIRLATGSV